MLTDLMQRCLKIAPRRAIGDGALGLWKAVVKIRPDTNLLAPLESLYTMFDFSSESSFFNQFLQWIILFWLIQCDDTIICHSGISNVVVDLRRYHQQVIPFSFQTIDQK